MKRFGLKFRTIYFVILLLSFLGKGFAQEPLCNPYKVADTAMANNNVNYLNAVNALKQLQLHCHTNMEQNMYLQASLTYNSFLQNNPCLDTLYSQWYKTPSSTPVILVEGIEDVMDTVLFHAQQQRVIMFNEQHLHPEHRYFVSLLLPRLYAMGFRYLALEAFWESSDSLMQRGYPVQSTGFYTREPVMGQLVRNALSLGFIPVTYDTAYVHDREYESALNLYNSTLKQDTAARVVVLAGIAHIYKAENLKRMAYHFGQISGIIPYTINQSESVVFARQMQKNTVYLRQGNLDNCDLYVINNLSVPLQEQNINMKNNLPLMEIELSQDIIQYLAEQQNLLLSVFRNDEFISYEWQSVPVLNYLLTTGQKHISLSVPAGQYVCIIRTTTGEEMLRQIINIEA
ncbi:MAG: hypothetical protein LBE11_01825 [Prevotellaceae bacterium]|jgi:hypothetical protein|nr:hypothetical protein [Prevotellaceae bacterium]